MNTSFITDNYPLILQTLGAIAGVWGVTGATVLSPKIPWLTQDRKTRIRAFSLTLSAVCGALIAYSDGHLTVSNLKDVADNIMLILTIWGGSHVTHTILKNSEPTTLGPDQEASTDAN